MAVWSAATITPIELKSASRLEQSKPLHTHFGCQWQELWMGWAVGHWFGGGEDKHPQFLCKRERAQPPKVDHRNYGPSAGSESRRALFIQFSFSATRSLMVNGKGIRERRVWGKAFPEAYFPGTSDGRVPVVVAVGCQLNLSVSNEACNES